MPSQILRKSVQHGALGVCCARAHPSSDDHDDTSDRWSRSQLHHNIRRISFFVECDIFLGMLLVGGSVGFMHVMPGAGITVVVR